MSGAACKLALCAWDEINAPPGDELEHAIREITLDFAVRPALIEILTDREMDRYIGHLEESPIGEKDQIWMREQLWRTTIDADD